jgi:hypothetical protein
MINDLLDVVVVAAAAVNCLCLREKILKVVLKLSRESHYILFD